MALGLKCGGTIESRAERLFSTKGKTLGKHEFKQIRTNLTETKTFINEKTQTEHFCRHKVKVKFSPFVTKSKYLIFSIELFNIKKT